MSKDIRFRRGLDIKLTGESVPSIAAAPKSSVYAITPDDFHGETPKLLLGEGAEVKAGTPLFYTKRDARIKVVSPVSGEVVEIQRGARRKIMEIRILADRDRIDYEAFRVPVISNSSAEALKAFLCRSGLWPYIRQRPYAIVANPDDEPRDIYISGFDSHPLAPDYTFSLRDKRAEIAKAVAVLKRLTPGQVHISLRASDTDSPLGGMDGIAYHRVHGPHPAGNVGVQIHHTRPINPGEKVWTVQAPDLVVIGHAFVKGVFSPERVVALAGSQVKQPKYYRALAGAQISSITAGNVKTGGKRLISGNPLTGTQVREEGFLRWYHNQITAIPEGNAHRFMGWLLPDRKRFSLSRAGFFSWLTPNKRYALDTNTNGEHRALVVTGLYEKVFPFDLYPMELLKATLTKDIDRMEKLGIYEIAPEDYALPEFVCPSKTECQSIIREGLDLMIEEVG
ncbi:MAG: Na(+)-translocating NADH-quinone reductase subunit A [Flavobacteriales bacterium]